MKRLGVLLLVLLQSGCGITTWFTGGESNIEPPTPLIELSQPAGVATLWSESVGAGAGKLFIKLTPVAWDGAIYVSDSAGRAQAFEAVSGKRLWETELKLPVTAGIGYGEGLVLLGTRKGQVVALARDSGKQLWVGNVSSEILAPPTVSEGVVVVQSVDGRVSGLAAASGERLWLLDRSEPPLSLRGTSAPVTVAGVVLTGFASGKLAAIGLKDGRLIWEIPVTQARGRSEIERLVDVDSAPLVIGKVLYAAAYQGKIVAVNLESGRILWSRDLSTYNEMDADHANLYITDEKGEVLALDLNTGATVWKQDKLRARFPSAPSAVGTLLAVGDFEGYVHWLARDDGRFIARHRASGAVRAKPAVEKDRLFVSTQTGSLSALRVSP
jgi:outer membrane protein assembly factor BamB